MAIARKLAYNVVFNSALKVISTVILSLLLVRLITGYLGQDGFGKYATVLAFFSFFSAIGDLGLGQVTAREIAKEGADEKNILGNVVGLRLVSSTILIVLAPAAILFFDYPAEVREIFGMRKKICWRIRLEVSLQSYFLYFVANLG